MVNASSTGALQAGQCFILATPYGGSALPCEKITQFRLSTYETNGTIGNYSWSTRPPTATGEANLVAGNGSILSVTLLTAGFGYFTAPAVSFTGGGSGATATATVSGGVVTGLTLTAAGTGYTSGGMTIAAPPAFVTASTGSNTVTVNGGGTITAAPAIVTGGGYYSAPPTVTVVTSTGSGANIQAVLTNGAVTGFNIVSGGTSYAGTDTFTLSAPTGSVSTATASATYFA
jgi:hypothetical protein